MHTYGIYLQLVVHQILISALKEHEIQLNCLLFSEVFVQTFQKNGEGSPTPCCDARAERFDYCVWGGFVNSGIHSFIRFDATIRVSLPFIIVGWNCCHQ